MEFYLPIILKSRALNFAKKKKVVCVMRRNRTQAREKESLCNGAAIEVGCSIRVRHQERL